MGRSLRGVPVPGGDTDDVAATAKYNWREVDVHLSGNGKGGGGVTDDGGIHLATQKHVQTVNF